MTSNRKRMKRMLAPMTMTMLYSQKVLKLRSFSEGWNFSNNLHRNRMVPNRMVS